MGVVPIYVKQFYIFHDLCINQMFTIESQTFLKFVPYVSFNVSNFWSVQWQKTVCFPLALVQTISIFVYSCR